MFHMKIYQCEETFD